MLLKGYHGAHLQSVERILQDGFIAKERSDHWLGQGIYFYTDFELAKWWSEKKFKVPSEVAVIAIKLEFEQSKLLDLDKVSGINRFVKGLKEVLKNLTYKVVFKCDTEDDIIRNFCFVLDLIKEHLKIEVVIMTFHKDNPSYGRYDLKEVHEKIFPLPLSLTYKERQICITNNSCITHKECCYPTSRKKTWS